MPGNGRLAGVWVLAGLLGGCVAPPPPPLPAPVARPGFAAQLAGPATDLAPMPTALVLLSDADAVRNRVLCDALVHLPTVATVPVEAPVAANVVVTRWPLDTQYVPADRAGDCGYLVLHYDYRRAAVLRGNAALTQGSLDGRGPFLVLVMAERAGMTMVGVDGSRVDARQFPQMLADWGVALHRTEQAFDPERRGPGLVRSAAMQVAAELRAVFGSTAGPVVGVLAAL